MQHITIDTSPVDSANDLDSAAEQLTEINQGDLVVVRQRWDRKGRRATLTVSVSREDLFRQRLAASPFARFYTVKVADQRQAPRCHYCQDRPSSLVPCPECGC